MLVTATRRRIGLVLYAATILAVGVPTLANSQSAPPKSDPAGSENSDAAADWLASLTPGADVVDGAGVPIEQVAAATGRSEADLDEMLVNKALWVDPQGMVLAFDPIHTTPSEFEPGSATVVGIEAGMPSLAASASTASPVAAQAPVLSVDQVFNLHSRPGSQRVAYLDFTGHVVSRTSWNVALSGGADIVVPAWGFDGSPAYGANERAVIQEIWQRVSEDFAPFDIDVTTAEPALAQLERTSASDLTFGTRLLMAPYSQLNRACDCGGVSYVGTFNRIGDNTYYQPGLVFSDALGTSNPKNLAEAASHEIGHALGLGHVVDGAGDYAVGHAAWAPIMGSSYDRPLSQWLVDGNYGGTAYDDVSVMTRHGVDLIADDHGNVPAASTALGWGPSVGASGVINSAQDVDVFRFTTSGGRTVIGAEPHNPGANLDVRLDLLTATGSVVASGGSATEMISAHDTSGLEAVLDLELVAGTYYIRVDGAGYSTVAQGPLNDHGSLGRYSVVATFPVSGNLAPHPVATASASRWELGAAVTFDSAQSVDADGWIGSAWWDFGDGSTSASRQVSKTFNGAGTYTVVLTVTDNVGAISSTAMLVTIGTDGGVISSIDLAGSTSSILRAARAAAGSPLLAAAPVRGSTSTPTAVETVATPAVLPETE